MTTVNVMVSAGPASAKIERLQQALTPEAVDPVVQRIAMQTLTEVVKATPKKWFGQVRAAWQVMKEATAKYFIKNGSKIMKWLEEGTDAHGPVKAKALFIPLTREAAMADRRFFGVGQVFEGANGPMFTQRTQGLRTRRGIQVFGGRTKSGKARTKTLVYGRDYVLAKRVKGIAPRGIVAAQRVLARERMKEAAKAHIRKALGK